MTKTLTVNPFGQILTGTYRRHLLDSSLLREILDENLLRHLEDAQVGEVDFS
ncbi:hypothetical protein OG407_00325 [Streptomyces sp. NBC_01515]|uniref:hypothetical protein n=1 Tax=Streptomyces sp. NBC_01515 TaxID=2903890 RepID=UPI00386A49E4